MPEVHSVALPPGYRLGEYEIVRTLGAGGFGITYLAFDHQLEGPVALKEYFPADVATRIDDAAVAATSVAGQETFAWGLDRFAKEARAIHRLRHPNVVQVHRYLEANGTAYIVMEYVEGESLRAVLERRGSLPANEWRPWMDSLLDGLAHVHSRGLLHRDIKPANIVVRSEDGEPVLIDFGAARLQHRNRTHTQVLTAGYAAIEQYADGAPQGPPSDIYALAAVSHRVLTGEPVPSAPDRSLADDYRPLAGRVPGAHSRWLAAIDHGLSLRPQDRPRTVVDWRSELTDVHGPPAGAAGAEVEPFSAEPASSTGRNTNTSGATNGRARNPSKQRPVAREPGRPPARKPRIQWRPAVATLALAGIVILGVMARSPGPVSPADSVSRTPANATVDELRAALEDAEDSGDREAVDRIERALAVRYRQSAEQGDSDAQLRLGHAYRLGNGVPQDYDEAAWWYRRSADQGNSEAQWRLGNRYENGEGVPRDYEEAVKWYRRSANQGNSDGQFQLGYAYYHGIGVPQDREEAVRWYRRSANQGNSEGQLHLGSAYYHGIGLPEDQDEAVKWLRQAAEQGYVRAQTILEEIQ